MKPSAGGRPAAITDEQISGAADLVTAGASWREAAVQVGYPNADSLRKAAGRLKKARAKAGQTPSEPSGGTGAPRSGPKVPDGPTRGSPIEALAVEQNVTIANLFAFVGDLETRVAALEAAQALQVALDNLPPNLFAGLPGHNDSNQEFESKGSSSYRYR